MLTDEEREHLRAEEIFRYEIRRQLEASREPTSKSAKLIRSLNTPFVLWVLSSVLVGAFGWAFSKFEGSRALQVANHETERKLDTEIGYRLQEGIAALDGLEERVRSGGSSFSQGYIYKEAIAGVYAKNSAVFPEYASRSLPSLMVELRGLVPSIERAEIDHSIEAYRALEVIANGNEYKPPLEGERRSDPEIHRMLSEIGNAKALIPDKLWVRDGSRNHDCGPAHLLFS